MGICEYKKKVREQLDEIMEKPVTLGRMEEAGIMAGLLYSLDALHGEHTETFTEADARAWVARMENADGSTGGSGGPERGDDGNAGIVRSHEHDVFRLQRSGQRVQRGQAGLLRKNGKSIFDG